MILLYYCRVFIFDFPTKLTMPKGRRMPIPPGVLQQQLKFFTRPPLFADTGLYTLIAFCCLGLIKVQHKYTTKKNIFIRGGTIQQTTRPSDTQTRETKPRHYDEHAVQTQPTTPTSHTHSTQLKSAKHMSNDAQQLCLG